MNDGRVLSRSLKAPRQSHERRRTHDANHSVLPVIWRRGIVVYCIEHSSYSRACATKLNLWFSHCEESIRFKDLVCDQSHFRARFAYSRYAHQFRSCCNSFPGTGSTTSSSSSHSLSADVLLTFRCCVTWVSCAEENVGLQLKLTSTALRNYGSC